MKIPNIDSSVEVTTRFRSISYFSDQEYQYHTVRGKVVKNDKWVGADSFSVYTGNPKFPVSVISLKRVADIKLISGSETKIRQFKVAGSKTYMVSLSGNHFSCECIGFKYYAKCKHITAVKKTLINQ
jgi:hypothetical protein